MTRKDKIKNLDKKTIVFTLKNSFSLQEFFCTIFKNKNINLENYLIKELKEKLLQYNLDLKKDFPQIGKSSPIWKVSSENFKKIVEQSNSITEILSYFNMKNIGSNYKTLKSRFFHENLDYDNFVKKSLSKGFSSGYKIKNTELFIKNSNACSSVVRKRVLKENLLEYKCQICGMEPIWQGKELSLTLDHINGINNDHRLENLRFVCPNCDRQLNTFAGKNVDRTKHILPTEEFIKTKIKENSLKQFKQSAPKICKYKNCNNTLSTMNKTGFCFKHKSPKICKYKNCNMVLSPTNKTGFCFKHYKYKTQKICKHEDCNKPLSTANTTGFCHKHLSEIYEEEKPYNNIQEVIDYVEKHGYKATGRKYGVSDNAIRKWIKKHNKILSSKYKTIEEKLSILENFIKDYKRLPYKKEKEYRLIANIRDIKNKLTPQEISKINKISPYILNPKQREIDEWFQKLKKLNSFIQKNNRFPTKKEEPSLLEWYRKEKYGLSSKDRTSIQLQKIADLKRLEKEYKK